MAKPTVLLVTRPVTPPWNDGPRHLCRALLAHGAAAHRVPTVRGAPPLGFARAVEEAIYPSAGGHGAPLANQLAMLGRLLRPLRADAVHALFAPTLRTARLLRPLLRPRRVPTIHTICSRPRDLDTLGAALFADHHIAVSADTAARLKAAGATSVAHVAPGVPDPGTDPAPGRVALEARGLPMGAPFVLYAGDAETSLGAETVIRALPEGLQGSGHHAVLACRDKTAAAAGARARLVALADELGVADRVHLHGTLPAFPSVVAAADALLFPTADTVAKRDLPLVLLEGLAAGAALVNRELGA